ncbi:MAG: NAD(P)-dependent oxidoreductase, partial [Alphaproteobacteria bacterium]|nr:NAD(P)-dependent oxidoreductase [Alphaproteobacteria bacterium]MDX5492843.1 NAD(P)-dependent oxidoreductase [Alphaproteobacteria bacterium]
MTVRWITPRLGTAPASTLQDMPGAHIADVRDLVDRAGNPPDEIRQLIASAAAALSRGETTIVCCDHGVSRSNAVAAGILSEAEGIPLGEAVRRVMEATGETEIRPDVIGAVRRALAGGQGERQAISGERWLLTGASGALGGLVRRTAPAGIELVSPGRTELDLLAGSATLCLYAEEHAITRILHFAAPRIGNTNRALGDALVMLRSVLEASSQLQVPVLMPSRWEVFAGYAGEMRRTTEETPLRPMGLLGETKFLCETLAGEWNRAGRSEVLILRSGLVFGGTIAPNFMRHFIRKARSGEPIVTHKYENGAPHLDMIAAADWADAFWRLVRHARKGLYQLGGGSLLSTPQIARIVATATKTGVPVKEL